MGTTEIKNRILNVGLKGTTLISKFLLVFVLAKYLQPSELGLYGLLVVSITYSTFSLGFEFYTFSSREPVRSDVRKRAQKLKNQVSLHVLLYTLIMPMLLLLFYFELVPWRLAPFFMILVMLEHLNQESMRLLIALQHQLTSSVALFLRRGLWALVLVAMMLFGSEPRRLDYVLIGLMIGSFLALCLSAHALFRISAVDGRRIEKTEWGWVIKGIKIALSLFVASFSMNFITTVDRYWFAALEGGANLGAYVLYMSIAVVVVAFADAGIFLFCIPG